MFKISKNLIRNFGLIRHHSSVIDFAKKYVEISEQDLANDASKPLLDHLEERGLIEQATDRQQLTQIIANDKISLYCGADPTAISLHLGNLLPLMVLVHFNLRGHNVIGLVGGATGAVGDPSGKLKQRDKIEDEIRLKNVERIQIQLKNFLQNGVNIAKSRNEKLNSNVKGEIKTVNNYSWWKDIRLIDFLATYGSHIRISSMLARDSVKSRLESPLGLGFNEFTYQILQLFDFYHLFTDEKVRLQVGGNDQYGNITAGIDLISRIDKSAMSFGLTVPLLTTSSGEKFGKSAGNAVFIDESLTSPFQLFQFMYNSNDADLKPFLYKYSFLPTSVIDRLIEVHENDKKQRLGQKILAMEVCDLIHGEGVGLNNLIISDFLFNGKADIPVMEILKAFEEQKMLVKMSKDKLSQIKILDLLIELDLGHSSKSKLKRLITSRSVLLGLNGVRIGDVDEKIDLKNCLIQEKLLFIRVGKTDHYVIDIQ